MDTNCTDSIQPQIDYDVIVEQKAEEVFRSMEPRVSPRQLKQLHESFEFARDAHKLPRS